MTPQLLRWPQLSVRLQVLVSSWLHSVRPIGPSTAEIKFSDRDATGFAAQTVTAFEATARADQAGIDEQAQQFAHCRVGQPGVLDDGFGRHLLGITGQAIGDQQAVIRQFSYS